MPFDCGLLAHRDLERITAIGVDEVQWHRGHKYQTVVYQTDENQKRLAVDRPRPEGQDVACGSSAFWARSEPHGLEFICSDMWRGYLKVIRKKASGAVHILDRFHVMQRINKALNDVRAAEVKQLKQDGYEPVLSGSRWVLLKRPENLTERQAVKLKELLQYNLKSVRSHLMREDFQRLWTYSAPAGPASSSTLGAPVPCGARSSR